MKLQYKSPEVSTIKVEPASRILDISINTIIASEPMSSPDLSRDVVSGSESDIWF